jgi:hypothetical protein
MFVMCLTYSLLVLGPWALVGNIVILLFYPIMVSKVVRLTNQPLLFRIKNYVVQLIQEPARIETEGNENAAQLARVDLDIH